MNQLTKLVDHCVWANELWIRTIVENWSSDEFLVARMSHILHGEQAWFDRVLGKEPRRDIWRALSTDSLWQEQRRNRDLYTGILGGDLDQVIQYKRFTGEEYQSPVSDILLHLTLHGTHHRGQMATYVSGKGSRPINTDFVQYCLVNRL
jgi:uncharacterized damage-inducible protein DinB